MKKKFLSLLLVMAMLCSLLIPASAAEEGEVAPYVIGDVAGALVILHTNDTHGRDLISDSSIGTAGVAQLKKDFEAAGAEVLLLSAGDASQGTPLVNMETGKLAIEFMNAAGYDAMAPGNHEFDWGTTNLLANVEGAEFAILSANILGEDGKVMFAANKVFTTASGLKVGVFGLTTPETGTKTHPDKIRGTSFLAGEAMFAAAQAQVDALKAAGCDLIVALGHLGDADESIDNRVEDLVAAVPGIDLFVDGHSHSTYPNGKTFDGSDTLVVSTGEYLQNVGAVTYKDGAISAELISKAQYDGADEELNAVISLANDAVLEALSAPFAVTEIVLNGNRAPGVRTQETNLGDFAADAILWSARQALGDDAVDAAITNGGGIRETIKAGDVTMLDMKTVFPFGNEVATVEITGAALLSALEASTWCTPDQIGAFPQVAGMEFTILAGVPYENGEAYGTYFLPANPGARIVDMTVGGEPLDLEATYVIATNDFTAAGGDTYGDFIGAPLYKTGVALEDALVQYTAAELDGVITAEQYGQSAGRIHVIPKDVTAGTWYTDAAIYSVRNGIMTGTENGFEPTAQVTRATVFHALYNMEGNPAPATVTSFTDVAEGDWYADSAAWAESFGITTGTGGGYTGARAVTRQEIAKIFADYMTKHGVESTSDTDVIFSDDAAIADWARDSVAAVVGMGLMQGTGGAFNPTGTATRAELAQLFFNLSKIETEVPEGAITGTVIDVAKYGNVTVTLKASDFEAAGFAYGDLLNVYTQYAVLTVPYATNYSDVDVGSLVARNPSTEENPDMDIIVAINMGNFSKTYCVGLGDELSFDLQEKEGYLSEYIARQLTRTNERDDYASDEVFANFRNVTVGSIAEGILYRSSSPVNNEIGRAEYSDKLIKAAGVATVINLANSAEEIAGYAADDSYATPYYDGLLADGQVICLNMGVDFAAADFTAKLNEGLTFMLANEGPYLVHCTEGKDRAGFVIAVLEALMGASADEIAEDYMLSFINYYGVEKGSEQYDIIAEGNILGSLRSIAGLAKGASLEGVDLVAAAEAYLVEQVGLSTEQVASLKTILSTVAVG